MSYDTLANRIEKIRPGLLLEVETEDLPEDKEKWFPLGALATTTTKKGRVKHYLVVRLDHRDATDDYKAVALAHEYGHLLCRQLLYPKLGGVGRLLVKVLGACEPYKIPTKLSVNLAILLEESIAWLVGWGILLKLGTLKFSQVKYGFKCWKTYILRLRPWVKSAQ